MLPCNVHDLLQNLAGIQRSGRVVGIDDNDRFRAVGYFLFDIVDIRVPVGLLVTDVVHRFASGEGGACRPQRIIRRGDEDFIAVVQKCGHTKVDQLADAVPGVNVVNGDVRDEFELRILHDCLTGREQPFCVGITLAFGELLAHVVNNLVRRPETEGSGIADVQL